MLEIGELPIDEFFHKVEEIFKKHKMNFEENRQRSIELMIKNGLTKRDAHDASELAMIINYVDRLAYSSLDMNIFADYVIRICTQSRSVAKYRKEISCKENSSTYYVIANNIGDISKQVIRMPNDKKYPTRQISKREAMLRIAVHEVRHSLQLNVPLSLFRMNSHLDRLDFESIIRMKKRVFEKKKDSYRQKKTIRNKEMVHELDSSIIDGLFSYEINRKKSVSSMSIMDFLLMQPKRP